MPSILVKICFLFFVLSFNVSAEENSSTNDIVEQFPVCDINDATYKKVGGRNICKRECRTGEIGPSGNLCVTKNESGSEEKFCDCGI